MSKETTKKPSTKKPEQKKTQPKVDYKKKFEEAQKQIELLKKQNVNLEAENQKNLFDFQSKAKTFQDKAQQQINDIKKELNDKLDKERDHIKKYGSQKLIESIVEPILNIDVAIKAGKDQEAVKAYVMGFEMLMSQLYNELSSFGITIIEPKVGDTFDPNLHYAMNVVNEGKSGTITDVKKKGIKYHDRVVKPATVIAVK